MVFFTFPMLIGFIAVADQLIEVLLTEKWLSASIYFKLLCLTGLFYSFQVVNGEILKTKGKSNWILKLELITRSIMVISIFITYRWGIVAIIWGQMFTVIVASLIGSYYVWKLIGYSIWQQLKDISSYFFISLAMYLLLTIISTQDSKSLFNLIMKIIVGVGFYAGIVWLLKLEELEEIKRLGRKK